MEPTQSTKKKLSDHFFYKTSNSFEARKKESTTIRTKYPTRIPVIAEMASGNSNNLPPDKKYKYLVPDGLTIGQLGAVFRKEVRVKPEEALFILTDEGMMPPVASTIAALYDKYKDPDGFIYFVYKREEIYG